MKHTITLTSWFKIIEVACSSWRTKLLTYAYRQFTGNGGDSFSVEKEFLEEMLTASDQSQKKLILSLFPDYNKEDPYKKFKDAEKEGKEVQFKSNMGGWVTHVKYSDFLLPVDQYRIKNKHQDLIDKWEASGRTLEIQFKDNSCGGPFWITCDAGKWDEAYEYRIKPKEKYVPYSLEDAKELIGKVVIKRGSNIHRLITQVGSQFVRAGCEHETYTSLLNTYTDIDGKPLGKLKK